jgi:hypothetical protein
MPRVRGQEKLRYFLLFQKFKKFIFSSKIIPEKAEIILNP